MLLAANCCNWRRPGLPLFGTSFLRVLPSTKSERALCLFFQFLMKKMLLPQPPIMLPLHKGLHTWWQQGGLPEEGENRRTFTKSLHTWWQQRELPEESENRRTSNRFYFAHGYQAPSMTA